MSYTSIKKEKVLLIDGHNLFIRCWSVIPTLNDNGEEIFVQGDDIIKLPDGSLTTMYHYLKNSEKGIEEVLSTTKFEDVDA